ncbi:MAG: hypothetical protein KTR32_05755 [Granulosicoccus sp.]|nr:hypothetical protein [Granulosicoccus sp.]
MYLFNSLLMGAVAALLVGCAQTSSSIRPEEIRDDGQHNVVVLTYDIKLYVPNRHSSVSNTALTFKCPQEKRAAGGLCFDLSVPYLGTRQIDGDGLHSFEHTGAKAVKIEYDDYLIQSVLHDVLINREPRTYCWLDKKLGEELCKTTVQEQTQTYSARIPEPIAVKVSSGSGCYLGHLELHMHNNQITSYNLDTEAPLLIQRFSSMPDDVTFALFEFVDRRCDMASS